MKRGIGLPDSIPRVNPARILAWAAKADDAPFSSLGTEDRLVYPNYDSLVTLAAAAGVTKRVRLVTNILIAPLRNAGVLAKQAASLDLLSGGRLTLGLAVGSRETDYRVVPANFSTRGRRFDEQLGFMKRVWAGEPIDDDIPQVGPLPAQPGGPQALIGGQSPAAIARVGRWGDGYIEGGRDAVATQRHCRTVQDAWRAHGRTGEPRLVGHMLFALGPGAEKRAGDYVRAYFAYRPSRVETMLALPHLSPGAIRETVDAFAAIGMDEIIFVPCIDDLEQVDRLADAVG